MVVERRPHPPASAAWLGEEHEMNPKSYRQVLDDALRKRSPDDVNVLPQIATRFTKGQSLMKTRKILTLSLATVLIAFVISMFVWPEAAVAMRRLLAYIPGLGLVESGNSLRILAEPVVVERDGVTVMVEKGTTDPQRTILRVSVKGVNATGGPYCDAPWTQLSLKDGTKLKETQSAGNVGGDWDSFGYTNFYAFPALPAGIEDVTLEIPCLWLVTGHENWVIPLHFVPADGSELNPVIEFPSDTPTEQPASQSPHGISLALDKVIPLDDGYLLIGSMRWSDANVNVSPYYDSIVAVDANGQEVALGEPEEIPLELLTSPQDSALSSQWMYKISGSQHAWPLTLKMDADVTYPADVSFPFDPGSNPQKGQVWKLDQDLTVNGHAIHIVSATSMDIGGMGSSLQIEMVSDDPAVTSLHLTDKVYHEVQRLCGGGGGSAPGKLVSAVVYCEPLAPELRTLTIDSISLVVPGPWQVTWQP
jgi:hypothetical protein